MAKSVLMPMLPWSHWMVKPVELSREAQGHPRSIFAIARRVWVHTDIGVRIYICSNSAISVRIAGDSNHRSKRCKCSWKGYVNRTAGKINSGSPLDRKACGIITWLAKTYRCPINPTTRTRIPLINSHAWTGLNVYCYRPFCSSMGACFSEGSYCHMARTKLSWEPNLSITCMGNIAHTPLYCETRGVITCLTKAENSKPWRPVVRPNRYGWIWIVDNTVFIVFGWTTRVWNNCPLNRSNGRKTSWETNAASGVCINHHPRNCKSRGVITCFI